MPQARGNPKLIFDAFVRLPTQEVVVAAWPDLTLEAGLFALAADLAAAIGYLGRAESWTECEALADWDGQVNCAPMEAGFSGDRVRVLAPLSPVAYAAERDRLLEDERRRIASAAKKPLSEGRLDTQVTKAFQSRRSGADTLPMAPRRRARARYGGLSGSRLAPSTRGSRGPLRTQDGGCHRHRSPRFEPPASFTFQLGNAHGGALSDRWPSPSPRRGHREDRGTHAARRALAVRLAARRSIGPPSAESAVAGFRPRHRRQTAQGPLPPSCLLAPEDSDSDGLNRPPLSVRRGRYRPRRMRQARSHHAPLAGAETANGRR